MFAHPDDTAIVLDLLCEQGLGERLADEVRDRLTDGK
jgi:hypothetical protein